MGIAIAAGQLHDTQTVAVRIKAHGLTVDCHNLTKVKVIGQISEMEEIGHRGAPNVMICLFLTQQTARRDAKSPVFEWKTGLFN
tara:strand:+ start:19830 stop:20081 length:252 start_codon:yes stop_codon:yes gene_type:complete